MKKLIHSILAVTVVTSNLSVAAPASSVRAATSAATSSQTSVTEASQYPTNDVIVVYKKEANATKKKTLKICSLEQEQEEEATVETLTSDTVVLKLDSEAALEQAIEALSTDERVDYIQPNYIYKAIDVDTTDTLAQLKNNPYFSNQWAYYNDGTLTYEEEDFRSSSNGDDWGWGFPDWGWGYWGQATSSSSTSTISVQATSRVDIHLPEALSVVPEASREAIVAIVDTGIKYDHADLKDSIWVNPGEIEGDGIDNDQNGYIDDVHGWNFYDESMLSGFDYGWYFPGNHTSDSSDTGNNEYYNANSTIEDAHGTHCAGTIVAANDTTGTVGIAANGKVKIMVAKALGGEEGYGTTESVIKGIQYAEENGADICNLSLGGEEDDELLRSTIQNSSMLFTIAAGNGDYTYNGIDNDKTATYPACYNFNNVLSVANIQCDGTLHYTSNYGATTVHLAAPGSKIYSTSTDTSGYEEMTGTSMAAPMVAGVAALLYSSYEEYSLIDIRNAIVNSTTPLDSLTGKCVSGGMLNAYNAMEYLSQNIIPSTATPIITTEPSEVPTTSSEPTVSASTIPDTTKAPTNEPVSYTTQPTIPTNTPEYAEPTVPTQPVDTQRPIRTRTPSVTQPPVEDPESTVAPTNNLENTQVPTGTPTPVSTRPVTTTRPATTEPVTTTRPTTTEPVTTTRPTTTEPVTTTKPTKTPNKSTTPTSTPTLQPSTNTGNNQQQTFVPTNTPAATNQTLPSSTPNNMSTSNLSSLTLNELAVSGDNVKLTKEAFLIIASANNGKGTIQYSFTISKDGDIETHTDFSDSSYINWTPTKAGTYKIEVTAKDETDTTSSLSTTVTIKQLNISKLQYSGKLKARKTIKITSKLNVSAKHTTYSYVIRNKSGKKILSRTTTKKQLKWKIPAKGVYKITLTIKDNNGNTAKKTVTCKVSK